MNINDKIKELIETIRPYINMDGGDIEFVQFTEGDLYIKLTGNCNNCIGQENTINEGLLPMFQEEIPEIKNIIIVPI